MGKYIRKFNTEADYSQASEINPSVDWVVETDRVVYNPYHDYSKDYFTMVVTTGGNIGFSGSTAENTLSYSKDNGENWSTVTSADTISVAEGDKVLWKGTPTPQYYRGIGIFSGDTTAKYSIEGNTMSLLFGDNFKGQTSLDGKTYALCSLFSGNTNVTSAENLSLPATTLTESCYQSMFEGCTSLTTAPELPATTLADSCYNYMFQGCTSLTTAPELPATELASNCYSNMFSNCKSLTTAPELPATTLAHSCYYFMFSGCKSLTTAPELPATTLTESCYQSMFQNCKSLTTAPELPATTLTESCYRFMFQYCKSLTKAPSVLPATTLANYCYNSMFNGCSGLTTAPELPALNLTNECYREMFRGCRSLTTIKCLATNISANNCTTNWVSGVPSSGTFTKAAGMTAWTSDANGIPSGWTVIDKE